MQNHFRYRIAASLFFLVTVLTGMTVLTGCRNEYDTIELSEKAEESAATTAGDGEEGVPETIAESKKTKERQLAFEDASGEKAADGAAVADLSLLTRELTMAAGFTETDDEVEVLENGINVRSDCSTDARVLVQLAAGEILPRTGYSGDWSRVLYEGETCYVKSEYLRVIEKEEPEELPAEAAVLQAEPEEKECPVSLNGKKVAIDAAHQAKGDPAREPIGPGSSTMKAKMEEGAEGTATKLPEYKLTLQVAEKLKEVLERRGYEVVMIRESSDVNVSSAERAKAAGESGASVYVRIDANSVENGSVHGTLSMCQTEKNPYNGALHDKSYSLSKKITDGICAATEFKNRGVQETDSMSGINWSTIPVSIVEIGFLSNPEEDRKMAQEEYQDLIAGGIANGIDAYFGFESS